jgi:ubiquinone/menaquinone biosynthesis C-methylase UbiE
MFEEKMALMDAAEANKQIARNIEVHNQLAQKYEALHGEIFNDIEQDRLAAALARARDSVRTGSDPLKALDFGCGSGNLSRHMLDLGLHVTAADVSPDFLRLVERRFPSERLSLLEMNGSDLSNVDDSSFDLIAAYSVLHHIPDYLAAIAELARVCRPGGVIMLDHEHTEKYWLGDPVYSEFRGAALRFDWRKYLTPSNYVHKVRRLINPRHTNEGDIHVFPDDHILWSKIKALLAGAGFEIVVENDYLLYHSRYRREVFERYDGRCTDTKLMIFRKLGPAPGGSLAAKA